MPTRPPIPDLNGSAGADTSAFSGLGAGMSFFQDWMKAAGNALPQMQAAAQGAPSPNASSPWNIPTLDPDELDKRIQDLKTVQFWLEQNARLINMTIQGLEVQRMTLTTLRGMNVSMDAVRDSLKAHVPDSEPAPAEAPQATAAPSPEGSAESPEGADQSTVNPMRWWDTLTQQFSAMASQAVQVAQASAQSLEAEAAKAAAAATQSADTPAPAAKRARSKTAKPVSKPAAKASKKTAAPKTPPTSTRRKSSGA